MEGDSSKRQRARPKVKGSGPGQDQRPRRPWSFGHRRGQEGGSSVPGRRPVRGQLARWGSCSMPLPSPPDPVALDGWTSPEPGRSAEPLGFVAGASFPLHLHNAGKCSSEGLKRLRSQGAGFSWWSGWGTAILAVVLRQRERAWRPSERREDASLTLVRPGVHLELSPGRQGDPDTP
jgi:hypothetical protein